MSHLSQAVTQFPVPSLLLIPLGIFIAIFIGVLVRTFQKSRRSTYEYMANLPNANEWGIRHES